MQSTGFSCTQSDHFPGLHLGGQWVEVDTLEEMEAAITDNTVMLYALGVADHLPQSHVSIGEMGMLKILDGDRPIPACFVLFAQLPVSVLLVLGLSRPQLIVAALIPLSSI